MQPEGYVSLPQDYIRSDKTAIRLRFTRRQGLIDTKAWFYKYITVCFEAIRLLPDNIKKFALTKKLFMVYIRNSAINEYLAD